MLNFALLHPGYKNLCTAPSARYGKVKRLPPHEYCCSCQRLPYTASGTVNLTYDLGNRIKPGRADEAQP